MVRNGLPDDPGTPCKLQTEYAEEVKCTDVSCELACLLPCFAHGLVCATMLFGLEKLWSEAPVRPAYNTRLGPRNGVFVHAAAAAAAAAARLDTSIAVNSCTYTRRL